MEKLIRNVESSNRERAAKEAYPHLRRQGGSGDKSWTLDNIRDGLQLFYEKHGRQPTAFEVDDFEYLPSSRFIQRSYGGLISLRKLLGHDVVSFASGKERSDMAKIIGQRGRKWELNLESDLVKVFGEKFVHIEKRFSKSGNRVDFYIYSPGGNFGVDIFYAKDLRSLGGSLRHKVIRYREFKELIYFVALPHESMTTMKQAQARQGEWQDNYRLVTWARFLDMIKYKRAYTAIDNT